MTSAALIWIVAPLEAYAQEAPAAPAGGTAVQEVVVTGTRIRSPNLQSVSPVQVVTSQDIAVGGRAQTIDILNQLPQANFSVGQDFGPTSDALQNPGGAATVDLRGLGPQRTLVLVDGKRLGIGDPNTGNTNPAPDINQIPSQLVDHIEVLTGGASAVYGSDAVAGVVNFIMKKNFEGAQVDAQWGKYQHDQHNDFMQGLLTKFGTPVPGSKWDGYNGNYSILLGMNSADGKGNVTGYATYFSQDPVFQGARDYSACQLKSNSTCGGSSNSNIVYRADGTLGTYTVVGNQFLNYPQAGSTPPPVFNSNPYESLIHQDTRYTGGFLAHYDYNDVFNPYLTFQFMHDQTNTQVAPSALFQGTGATATGGYLVNCNNPLLSAQEAGALGCTPAQIASANFANPPTVDTYFGRRNIEGGPREFEYSHDNFRVVLGSKGKLWGPFTYDLYGSYYNTSVFISNANFLSISHVQNALLVSGTAANPVCITGGSSCVPYNIFQTNGVAPNQLPYLTETGTSRGSTTEAIVEGSITGNLAEYGGKTPWASEGVGIAAGFQVRRDTLTYTPDQAELSNDMSGFGGAAVSVNNALSVSEGYVEVRAPIVQDRDWFHDLSLNSGYRYSAYSTGINANTFKGGGEWAPTTDFRFRGGFNRAVRAPNIIELYTPQSVTNTSVVSEDPCAAGAAHPASLAACLNTGATAANYGRIPQCPANQCAVLQGGNPDLQPETADTYTVGGVFTPRFIPGLQASIDYYHIDLTNIISNIPLGVSLNNCLAGNLTYCKNIIRNPVNGILFGNTVGAGGYFVGTNVNVASEIVQGLDIQGSYRLPLSRFGHDDWGSLSFTLNGSVNMGWQHTPLPGAKTYDCQGLFGPQCQGVYPEWRHNLRMTWSAPHNVDASITWRYIGGAEYEADSSQPTIGGSKTPDPLAHTIPAVNYMDVAVSWRVRPQLTLRAGVNNILDQDPPLIENAIVGNANPNSYPVYDLLGRQLFLSLTAKF
jgi:outer membrane receptor protein involved in Fe transport